MESINGFIGVANRQAFFNPKKAESEAISCFVSPFQLIAAHHDSSYHLAHFFTFTINVYYALRSLRSEQSKIRKFWLYNVYAARCIILGHMRSVLTA